MRFDAILLDADETLFDFPRGEREAIGFILRELGVADPAAPDRFHDINADCWHLYERGEITQAELRARRFRLLMEEYAVAGDARDVAERYVDVLKEQAQLLPGALELVVTLAAHRPLAIVTNGISRVQHRRFEKSGLSAYIGCLAVSEDVGAAKPNPALFHDALRRLGGCPPGRAIMLGDSVASDIKGANNAGVAACWLNPRGLPRPEDARIDYEIRALADFPAIALAK